MPFTGFPGTDPDGENLPQQTSQPKTPEEEAFSNLKFSIDRAGSNDFSENPLPDIVLNQAKIVVTEYRKYLAVINKEEKPKTEVQSEEVIPELRKIYEYFDTHEQKNQFKGTIRSLQEVIDFLNK